MSLATLDTHEVFKDLQSAGFTDAQAEAVARNIRKAQDLDLSTLATKSDLEELRTSLSAEIASVRADLGAEIASVRADLGAEIASVRADLGAEIASVRADLGAEIAKVRLELGLEIGQLRASMFDIKGEMVKWVFGAIGFQTLITLGGMLALLKTVKT